ncbi:MAG: alpha/beta hydrolase [bacterium]
MTRLQTRTALLLASGFFVLGFFERRLIYYPTRVLEATPSAVGLEYEDLAIRTADGLRLHGWFVPGAGAGWTLLFLHGNAGNIGDRVENLRLLHDLGLQVCIIDYRGYGRSEGSPTEEGLYRDADAAYSWLLARADVDPERIVVFGRSLGAAVAVDLCARVGCRRLILEGAFPSAAEMARAILPLPMLDRLLPERFAAAEKIPNVRAPLLQFHGARDEVVPFELGVRLFEAAHPPKAFVPVPGAGHNDVWIVGGQAYADRIRTFLAEAAPPSAGRSVPEENR